MELAKYKLCSARISCGLVVGGSKRRWLGADPKPRRRRAWVTAATGAERRNGKPRGINWAGNQRERQRVGGGSMIAICEDETRREDGWRC